MFPYEGVIHAVAGFDDHRIEQELEALHAQRMKGSSKAIRSLVSSWGPGARFCRDGGRCAIVLVSARTILQR